MTELTRGLCDAHSAIVCPHQCAFAINVVYEFDSVQIHGLPSHNSGNENKSLSFRLTKRDLDLGPYREVGSCEDIHAMFAEVDAHALDARPSDKQANRQRNPFARGSPARNWIEEHAETVSARRFLLKVTEVHHQERRPDNPFHAATVPASGRIF